MKDKPSEWVSISDLMAGVMAVVMLLLVVSVLQKTYAEMRHKQEMEQGGAAQQKHISKMLSDLKTLVDKQGASNLISFDLANNQFTLKDGIFDKGSACITPKAAQTLQNIEQQVISILKDNPQVTMYIEGHTDSLPVSNPVTDHKKFCTVYDDNFTLSAARAREARKVLIPHLSGDDARRLIVAGFGDSHPLNGVDPTDALNRRVEIQYLVQNEQK